MKTPMILAGLALFVLSAAGARAELFGRKAFSFRQAELTPADTGAAAARAFVRTRLTPGVPLAEAVSRLKEADMPCPHLRRQGGPPGAERRLVCTYFATVSAEGGTLGEDTFTVTLVTDASGLLKGANVTRSFIGTAPRDPG